jgi:hypothetical protein
MIYKLNYTDKETAIADLILKEVIDTEMNYLKGTHALVEIGIIENKVGYAYDLMSDNIINFGSNEIFPVNPVHGFAGN